MPILKCKITNLADTIWPLVMADVPVCIYGATGIGKSKIMANEIMPKVRETFGSGTLHDHRLSTKDITDGTGMPIIDREEKATYWTRPAFIPADDGKMHVMFYDEFGHASVQLQQMAYSIVHDRALGEFKLPKQHRVILASNTREDGGGDQKMLKPLENRMAHVFVEVDREGFQEKIKTWGWDIPLIVFLKFRPQFIHSVSETEPGFPTPRSLEALSRALTEMKKNGQSPSATHMQTVAHAICGQGFATEFGQFLKQMGAGIPKIEDILANPSKAKVPTEAQYQQVVAQSIALHMKADNATAFAVYLQRLQADVAVGCVHAATTRDASLKGHKALKELEF